MATTDFVDHSTIIEASWLNEVDNLVHDIFNNPSTAAETLAALGIVSTIPELNLLSGKADVLESADIGTTVQAYDADTAKLDAAANFTAGLQDNGNAVLDTADIGVTVQGYDADTAKYDDATANFTGTLQASGTEVATRGANVFTGVQSVEPAASNASLVLRGPNGFDSSLYFQEQGTNALVIQNDSSANYTSFYKYTGGGGLISTLRAYEDGVWDLVTGTLKYDGEEVATLGANTFDGTQTLSTTGTFSRLLINAEAGQDSDFLLREDGVNAFYIQNDASLSATYIRKYNGGGSQVSRWGYDESGNVDLQIGTLLYDGEEVASASNTLTLTNKTLTSPAINTSVSGTAILDEDDMSSNSATKLATQQSIKAYVDTAVATASCSLDFTNQDTFQNCHTAFSVKNGEVYILEFMIAVTTSTADCTVRVNMSNNHISDGLAWTEQQNQTDPVRSAIYAFNTDYTILTSTSAEDNWVRGFVEVTPSADGTLVIQAKQDTASANSSIVEAGSFVRLSKQS